MEISQNQFYVCCNDQTQQKNKQLSCQTELQPFNKKNVILKDPTYIQFNCSNNGQNIVEQSFKKHQEVLKQLLKTKKHQAFMLDKNFEDCFQLCLQIWQDKEISSNCLEKCSFLTLMLVQSIVFRKFRAHVFINTPEMLSQCLKKIRNKNLKRKDEMIKQGLVLFFDVLKKINNKQTNFYQYFYCSYLINYVSYRNYEKYFYQTPDKPNKIYIRKVNRIVIKLLSQNKAIKMIIQDLQHLGLKIYKQKVQKQLRKIVFTLQNKFIQKQLSNFENASQTDIPWTIFEVQKAIEYLQENMLEY